jgi:hypothetical protein
MIKSKTIPSDFEEVQITITTERDYKALVSAITKRKVKSGESGGLTFEELCIYSDLLRELKYYE